MAADVNVLVTDAYGNPCPTFTGTLLLTSSDGAASLPGGGSLTFGPGDAGRLAFSAGVTFHCRPPRPPAAEAAAPT